MRTFGAIVYKPAVRRFPVRAEDPDAAALEAAKTIKGIRTMIEVQWEEGPHNLPRRASYFSEGGSACRVDGRVY